MGFERFARRRVGIYYECACARLIRLQDKAKRVPAGVLPNCTSAEAHGQCPRKMVRKDCVMEKKRISCFLNFELLSDVDRLAKYHGMSRSAAISVLIALAIIGLQGGSDSFDVDMPPAHPER